MRRVLIGLFTVAALAMPALAADPPKPASTPQARPESRIDYGGFQALTAEVAQYRLQRLVTLERFNALSRERGTLILDARSPEAFRQGHIRGAVNLTLTDFTAGRLEQVIGRDRNRRVLIYCNNNFLGDREPVRTKMVQLALNIQTFINLYGYGYRNVYELRDSVALEDPDVHWVRG